MPVLTRSGLGALVTALCLGVLGWLWSYEELIVIGVALAMVVILAIWVARRPLRATVTRGLGAVRVPRGDSVNMVYRLRNDSRFRSGRATIVDSFDGRECRTPIEPVSANTVGDFFGSIQSRRRGVFNVGPFEIERIDPFFLALGSRRDSETASVTVHPKVYDLVGPQGAARVVENETVLRRASADPMSGFVSMREYVSGDDPRMIHWPTTARTGTLMVREHVEVRRPEFTVVLDAAQRSASAEDFEEAVDVAATLAAHAIRSGLDVVVRTTARDHAGRPTPITSEGEVLDYLTPVAQVDDSELVSVSSLFIGGFDHTSIVMVTGPSGPSSRFAALEQMVIVRVGDGAELSTGIAITASDAADFVTRWQAWS